MTEHLYCVAKRDINERLGDITTNTLNDYYVNNANVLILFVKKVQFSGLPLHFTFNMPFQFHSLLPDKEIDFKET